MKEIKWKYVLALCVATAVATWLFVPAKPTPQPAPDRPVVRFLAKVLQLMIWAAFFDAYEEPVDEGENKIQQSTAGGPPLVNHRRSL
jgi:cell division protein FtsW (lipid II flippase)